MLDDIQCGLVEVAEFQRGLSVETCPMLLLQAYYLLAERILSMVLVVACSYCRGSIDMKLHTQRLHKPLTLKTG